MISTLGRTISLVNELQGIYQDKNRPFLSAITSPNTFRGSQLRWKIPILGSGDESN